MTVIFSVCMAVFLFLSVGAQVTFADDSPPTNETAAATAFVNVSVIPMDSKRVVPGQTVIVRGDRISEVGPIDTTEVPDGALRIDGRDKYLMPGLTDMHVHLRHPDMLTLFLGNGVTSIRNMWGIEWHLRIRDQIKKGELVGPTVYTAGPIIDGNPPVWPQSTVVKTPDEAAKVVSEHKQAGYDFIKIYNRLSSECYDAIIEAGAKNGMRVVGHVPSAVGLEHALAAGQYTIEHLRGYGNFLKLEDSQLWEKIDEVKVSHIAQTTREAGAWNCPTLVVNDKMMMSDKDFEQELKRSYMKYIPASFKKMWIELGGKRSENSNRSLKVCNMKRMVKALHDAGARILLGTDTPNPCVVPGFSLHEELQNLVDAGLTPYEAIRAGTSNAAECLGALSEFGTISAGLRADLILVEGNPLEDVGNTDRRVGVMLRGRWFPQSELQTMLDNLAIKYASE